MVLEEIRSRSWIALPKFDSARSGVIKIRIVGRMRLKYPMTLLATQHVSNKFYQPYW